LTGLNGDLTPMPTTDYLVPFGRGSNTSISVRPSVSSVFYVGLSCRVSFVNRCAIKVTSSRTYLMRNGRGENYFLLCIFITGAIMASLRDE